MSFELDFLPEAAEEIEAVTKYYGGHADDLGVRFRREVEEVCRAAQASPLLWRMRPGGYRRVNLRGFPYYVAFFIRGNRLLVAAVGHGSRRPNYWKKRMR